MLWYMQLIEHWKTNIIVIKYINNVILFVYIKTNSIIIKDVKTNESEVKYGK